MKTNCMCGHELASHRHYRPGTDCAECAAGACTKFRAANRTARLAGAIVAMSQLAFAGARRRRRVGEARDRPSPPAIDIIRRSADIKRSSA